MQKIAQEEIKNKEMVFTTLVKKDHKFGKNDYVRGRLSGIQLALCDGNNSQRAGYGIKEGRIMITKCTPDKYENFIKLVEKHYPDLCVFNYECDLKALEMEARRKSLERQNKVK